MGVVVGPKHQAVDVVGEVAFHVEAPRSVSRDGDERHHHPIGGEQADDPEDLAADAGVQDKSPRRADSRWRCVAAHRECAACPGRNGERRRPRGRARRARRRAGRFAPSDWDFGMPAARRFPRESVMATPTIQTNEGNTVSVMVQPCHSACSNWRYESRPLPALLTSTMRAMVAPRKASSETRRGAVFSFIGNCLTARVPGGR